MSEQQPDPDPIEVTYTAKYRVEPWEVAEFQLDDEKAVENLMENIRNDPRMIGEIEIEHE